MNYKNINDKIYETGQKVFKENEFVDNAFKAGLILGTAMIISYGLDAYFNPAQPIPGPTQTELENIQTQNTIDYLLDE